MNKTETGLNYEPRFTKKRVLGAVLWSTVALVASIGAKRAVDFIDDTVRPKYIITGGNFKNE